MFSGCHCDELKASMFPMLSSAALSGSAAFDGELACNHMKYIALDLIFSSTDFYVYSLLRLDRLSGITFCSRQQNPCLCTMTSNKALKPMFSALLKVFTLFSNPEKVHCHMWTIHLLHKAGLTCAKLSNISAVNSSSSQKYSFSI